MSTPPTHRELLKAGISRLKAAGIDGGREDARFLLFEAAGISSGEFIMCEHDPVDAGTVSAFEAMIERRLNREPVSLIIGHTDFMGQSFLTDVRALAPRGDSERLVEMALELTADRSEGRIVDLGTGSGCLILSFLSERPGWTGTGLDLSPDALSLTRENAERLRLGDRLTLIEGSWAAAEEALSDADLVLSNPPYIVSDVIDTLDPEVREHDPMLALDGGEDGLTAYRDIIALCETALSPGTPLLFEIGYDQAESVSALLSGHSFAELEVGKDFSGHNRVVNGIRL